MKRIFSLIILTGLVVTFYACRKNDNPKLPEGITKGVLPQLVQDDTREVLIQEMADFNSAFSMDLYFKDGEKPKKMDLKVAMDGDYTNVKTLQADITTFPVKQEVTGVQLAQLFGIAPEDVTTGQYFEIRPDITLPDGSVLPAFQQLIIDGVPTNTEPYGSDGLNFPESNVTITYKKVCPLKLEEYLGTDNILTVDDKDFYEASYPVTVKIEGNTWTFKGWVELPNAVVTMTLDPRTYKVTFKKQIYAPLAPELGPYHDWTIEGKGDINPCDTSITVSLNNSVKEGGFGTVSVKIFKKSN
ncbi:hypothetical protein [Chitinophaga sp. MM2321]|uniref:hypothetical protein n=1 Tax=Chitinophaga sp. MM2321 TaxID=3137178 RepID=UPI0032D57BBE